MTAPLPSRATLGGLILVIRGADLPSRKRQELISAVNTIARGVGRSSDCILTDLRTLNAEVSRASPLAAAISPPRWRNAQSLLRAALKLANADLMPVRSLVPINEEWQPLYAALTAAKDRYALSRLFRWLSANGISPPAVRAEHFEQCRAATIERSLLLNGAVKWQQTLRAWNRAVDSVPGWPQLIAQREVKSNAYSLPWTAFPETLKADVDAWIRHASQLDLTTEEAFRPLSSPTLKARLHLFQTHASALVHRGVRPASLVSIESCLTLPNYELGLRFFLDRLGQTATVHQKSFQLRSIARHWCAADEPTLHRMAQIVRKLDFSKPGLTQKNRQRLLQLRDPAKQDALLNLPDRLRDDIDRRRVPAHHGRILAQMAVAIEVLLTAPIRIKNLAALEIERHLVIVGEEMHLVIPASEVKNDEPLHFAFSKERTKLLIWYLDRLRVSDPRCRFLFPGVNGRQKAIQTLRIQLAGVIRKRVGVDLNPHVFRHFGAMLYLEANPGGYEIVRRVLGHKRQETTSRFYVGLESLSAARHFDGQVQRRRGESGAAVRR